MQLTSNNIQTPTGDAIDGAQVLVKIGVDNALLFSDNGVTPIANPVITDANGIYKFFAANGRYNITVTSTKLAAPIQYNDVILFDPEDSNYSPTIVSDLANQTNPALGAGLVGWLSTVPASVETTVAAYLDVVKARLLRLKSKSIFKNQLGGIVVNSDDTEIAVVAGNPTTPLTTVNYRKPVVYAELHTNSAMPDSSDWGNPKKAGAFLAEVLVYGAETGEINTFNGRVFSDTTAPVGAYGLVGVSALAQSNAPSGTANRDVWGANLIAASSTGTCPANIVGVEVDLIPSEAIANLRPGQPGAKNVTAYWAQAASLVANSNTAFFASSVSTTFGWLNGIVIDAPVFNYLGWLRNSQNAPSAKGLRIETQWAANSGRVLELFAFTNEQFRVDGDPVDPIWIRTGGVLKQITADAPNSGGAGFRNLVVAN